MAGSIGPAKSVTKGKVMVDGVGVGAHGRRCMNDGAKMQVEMRFIGRSQNDQM